MLGRLAPEAPSILLLDVEEAAVPRNHQTERESTIRRRADVHDVHDIRALTDTGVIALPQRRASMQDGESKPGS